MSDVNRYIDMDAHAINSVEYCDACMGQLTPMGSYSLMVFCGLKPDTIDR